MGDVSATWRPLKAQLCNQSEMGKVDQQAGWLPSRCPFSPVQEEPLAQKEGHLSCPVQSLECLVTLPERLATYPHPQTSWVFLSQDHPLASRMGDRDC